MKVAIIGGGAIGLLFSYYMNLHYEVTLFVRNEKQKEKILKDGLSLIKSEQKNSTLLKVKMVDEWGKEEFDLSIICVKQYHLSQLQYTLQEADHPLLFIQNGMGHLHILQSLRTKTIYLASVEHGALRQNENTVIHTGVNRTRMAIYRGGDERFLQRFLSPFSDEFSFTFEQSYLHMLEKKLVVNAIINPLTAILKVTNGRIIDNDYFKGIVEELYGEISEVLSLGEKREQYYENVLQVAEKTKNNQSSMLKDLSAGRLTEIDAILGYLLKEAERKQIKTPLISILYYFIKGLELEGGGR